MRQESLRLFMTALVVPVLLLPAAAHAQENADGFTFRQILFSELFENQFHSPFAASVAPDGGDVYVSSRVARGVSQFSRSTDGTLALEATTFFTLPTRGASIVTPYDLVSAPNGRHVYVAAEGLINGGPSLAGIIRLNRNLTTGALSQQVMYPIDGSIVEGIHMPIYLAQSPDGRHIYVLNDYSAQSPFYGPSIGVVSTDVSTGAVAVVQSIPLNSQLPSGFDTFADITVSPDGQNVYVARGFDEGVEAYTRNATTGALTFLDAIYLRGDPRGFVTSVVVSPDGDHVYAVESLGGMIAILDRAADGRTTLPAGNSVALAAASRLVMAPDGQRVYATTAVDPVTVNAYSRNAATGMLTLLETITDGVSGSLSLRGAALGAMDPDSEHLYLPSSQSNSLSVFAVERPELPCEDFPLILNEYEALAAAYDLYEDVDFDGLPESASLALLEEASCSNVDDSFDEAVTNAYLLNSALLNLETEIYETGEWTPYRHVLSAIVTTSVATRVYMNQAFGLFPGGVGFTSWYVSVNCEDGDCEPSDQRNAQGRWETEPFAGDGDPDDDGFTNAEEWTNVLARGGSEREFAVSALDASNDGSTAVTFEGSNSSGSCFIATAAYGTPMAEELNTLRSFRDSQLLTNPAGASFTDMYYRMSPPIAEFIADYPRVRAAARAVIAPITRWVK